MLLTDFMASWYSTFSGQDVFDIQKNRPGLFFIFFVLAVVLLTTAINTIGYILQLIYIFAYGGGSYDPGKVAIVTVVGFFFSFDIRIYL